MKFIATLLLALCGLTSLFAQRNVDLLSNFGYSESVNDVWGYAAPDGTEYAIVGTQNVVSFVRISEDGTELTEVGNFPGANSTWRDMKTWRNYAYAVADEGSEGLIVYDLSDIANDNITERKNRYSTARGTFGTAHNIYVDTVAARAYVAGGIYAGILIFDLDVADPMTPELIKQGPTVYSHDVYVKNDIMYTSDIFAGDLKIYDISDLEDIRLLGSTPTPFNFTHNAWTTEDQQFVFTTDERANAPVAAYDISDLGDIRETFQFRPLASVNTGTIPHNVHVIDEYLSISYYTDGLIVADASEPDNIIEVANYDSYLGPNGDFNGNWGAYPFLPSGRTLISDRQTGLYVLGVNYVRAARLEGIVTDSITGRPINGATVVIDSDQVNGVMSNASGVYKTGLAAGGTYTFTVTSDPRYFPKTVTVDLTNDVIEQLNVELSPRPTIDISATVVAEADGTPIEGATLLLIPTEDVEGYNAQSSATGAITLDRVFSEIAYDLAIIQWGYQTIVEENVDLTSLAGREFRLSVGYTDDFITDEGWTVTNEITGSPFTGAWERGAADVTFDGSAPFQSGSDVPGDLGNLAYYTGLSGATVGSNDVDNGETRLTSPVFDATIFDNPAVTFQYWFATNGRPEVPGDDALRILLDNGTTTVEIASYDDDARAWLPDTLYISEFVEPTATMTFIAVMADQNTPSNNGHIVESAIDQFSLIGDIGTATQETFGNDISVVVYPNPTADRFRLAFDLNTIADATLNVTDVTGRLVETQRIGRRSAGAVFFGNELRPGVYFLEIVSNNQLVYTTKVIKR